MDKKNKKIEKHTGSVMLRSTIEPKEISTPDLITSFNDFFTTNPDIKYKTEVREELKDGKTVIITQLSFSNVKAYNTDDTVRQIKSILSEWYTKMCDTYPELDTQAITFNAF